MRILLVERDAELASLLAFVLDQGGHDSSLAVDRAGALQLLQLEGPDLALLAQGAPEPDALELCREIRRRSELPIMVLSPHDREDDLVAAFDAGADDYLRKPFSPRVLLARVTALLRRLQPVAPTVVKAAQVTLDLNEQTLQVGTGPPVHLTPHEFGALRLLIGTPGRTVTAERLLMQLWGSSSRRNQHMLKQLIYRLRQKVEADPATPRLIITTPHAGYRLVTQAADYSAALAIDYHDALAPTRPANPEQSTRGDQS
jgi:DNA-binding response OmpR family regulator